MGKAGFATEIENTSAKGRRVCVVVRTATALHRHVVDQAVVRIGRASDNDVVINDPMVSRRHLRIRLAPPSIEDLGSKNGTAVGSDRLPPHVAATLPAGSLVILAGCVTVTLQEDRREAPNRPARSRAHQGNDDDEESKE